jgi:hypothetical protein
MQSKGKGCTDVADNMELCDTFEMLDMFSEYYVADKADMKARRQPIADSKIVSPFDIDDEAFELGYMGGSSNQIAKPRNDLATAMMILMCLPLFVMLQTMSPTCCLT